MSATKIISNGGVMTGAVAVSYRVADNAKQEEKYAAIEDYVKAVGAVRLGTTSLFLVPTADKPNDLCFYIYHKVGLDEDDAIVAFDVRDASEIFGRGDVNYRYVKPLT